MSIEYERKCKSTQTRTSINSFVIGLFPNKKFKDPNQRTEEFLEQNKQN